MALDAPHFVLFSDTAPPQAGFTRAGRWRFVLAAADGSATQEAADEEPGVDGERLELLALVRGLEALDQPSHVTLITSSRYVSRGLRWGLESWRETQWQWERFGEMVPIRNADLWQRIDHALQFHRVTCCQRPAAAEVNSEVETLERPTRRVAGRTIRLDDEHRAVPAPAHVRRPRRSMAQRVTEMVGPLARTAAM